MATEVHWRPVPIQRPVPVQRPLPPRTKVGYPKGVTCCIAALCRNAKENCIVLCSDTRLDMGDLGSTNMTCKVNTLGRNWCVQLAGEWSGAMRLASILKKKTLKRSRSKSTMETLAHAAVDDFLKSPLCHPDSDYQLLVSGFTEEGDARLFVVSVNQGQPRIVQGENFACIGSGEAIASSLLMLRECHGSMDVSYVSYLSYEAKRASEKQGSVGKFTSMCLHFPKDSPLFGSAPASSVDWANLKVFSMEGVANLDNLYRGLWKIPVFDALDFPESFFHPTYTAKPEEKQDPQLTTDGQSRQQPLPESPEGSDES